jgi:hypothetical protein
VWLKETITQGELQNVYKMEKCNCVNTLRRNKKNSEIIRIINTTITLDFNTSRIIIFSDLDDRKNICINTVKYVIYKGTNYICICRLTAITPRVEFKIATDYLLVLEKLKVFQPHSEAFRLKYSEHRTKCKVEKISSLQTICQQKCFLLGLNNKNFVKLVKEGEIPEEIYENRPKRYNHLNFFSFSDIFQIYCSASQAKVLSCARPMSHLGPDAINHQ